MFNEKQIACIKELGLDLDFDNLSDDDYDNIEELIVDNLMNEFDENYHPSEKGLIYESILDDLP